MSAIVYLVGAGPGAPDLLTVRAARLLGEADIVFHDALVHPETLALAVRAEKVAVGKRCGRHSTVQQFINKRLIDAARRHKVVVRLKGGDPMLFGRAQEELDALSAAGIRCEVVPGVTAALAASAELGVSLTRRGVSRSVAFVTPRVGEGEKANDWVKVALAAETVALYMGAGEAGAIAAALIAAGKPGRTPVAIAENVSLEGSTVVAGILQDLEILAAQRGNGPAVVLIGDVWEKLAARKNRDRPYFSHGDK
jgi:uroporphyrin-III C-methyltransferase